MTNTRGKLTALVMCAALLLGGCTVGGKDYSEAVKESVSKSDEYEVEFVSSVLVGLGTRYVVVAVEFDHVPTDGEFADLVRDVTAPFPSGSRSQLILGVDVPTDPKFSLEEVFGDWFPGAGFVPNQIITDVSVLRKGVEGR